MKSKLLIVVSVIIGSQLFAQSSTYEQVYTIFQAKCASCHNQSVYSGQLNLGSAPATVYTSIVNHNPINPAAVSAGYKLIAPGDPHRSSLMRKINNSLDPGNNATVNEGAAMPQSPNPPLSDYEIELVRQWILAGAPQTGMVVDTSLLTMYYSGQGINSIPVPLTPPPASQGFQVHIGKVFIPPATEQEFFIKYNPKIASNIEVYRVELMQSPQSHHLVVYKFFPGQDVNFRQGLRSAYSTGSDGPSHGSADALAAFSPLTTDCVLPTGTAYKVEGSSIFDINLHIPNSNPDSVLAAEIYINFYTQPSGTAQKIMYRRNFPKLDIIMPPGDTTTFDNIPCYDSSETNMWQIWNLYSHTHRYGIDYDIWRRNPDLTKGDQIYEGFYNYEYTFNQGYYGWGVHSAQEHFSPFLEVNPSEGMLSRVIFYNYGTDTARFGLTSLDEMAVIGFEYTYGDPIPTKVPDIKTEELSLNIYPNPYLDEAKVSYTLKENATVKLEVYNLVGEKVETIASEEQSRGNHVYTLKSDRPGIYFLNVTINGKTYTKKLIKSN
jgi:hypothetical protein